MIKRLIHRIESKIFEWILPSGGSVMPWRASDDVHGPIRLDDELLGHGGYIPGDSASDTVPAVLSRGGRLVDADGNVIRHDYLDFGWIDCEGVYHSYDENGMRYEDYVERCPVCRVNKPRSKP